MTRPNSGNDAATIIYDRDNLCNTFLYVVFAFSKLCNRIYNPIAYAMYISQLTILLVMFSLRRRIESLKFYDFILAYVLKISLRR